MERPAVSSEASPRFVEGPAGVSEGASSSTSSQRPPVPRAPLTSGDLARECATTVRTVRFYEEAGLVEPSGRSEGGHRVYGAEQVAKLSLVLDLREAGLSIQEIRELFDLKRSASSSLEASERMTAALHRRIDEMQAKIAVLRRLRDELTTTASMLRECRDCDGGDFPADCARCDVMNRADLPRAMRLLWG